MRATLGVLLVLALLPTSTAGYAGEDAALPDVLRQHGFDAKSEPITVVFTSPAGDANDHPTLVPSGDVAPVNTVWVFEDPAPVREALSRAKTRRFSPGQLPGAEARLILYVGSEGAAARIYLHDRPGWGTVKADRTSGGEWHFDPAADRALVALLSRTPPHAVGVPVRGVIEAAWKPGLEITEPDFGTFDVRADWARLKRHVVPRHAATRLELPPWFSWDEHFVAVVWGSRRSSRDRLDWGNARLADDTITWDLREDREKEEAEGWAPVTIGFFDKVRPRFVQIAVRLDGRVVKTIPFWRRMPMPGQARPVALLVPRDGDGVRIGMLALLADATWVWEPDDDDKEGSGVREGPVPPGLVKELRDGFGAWKVQPSRGSLRMHDVRLDDEAGFPPGTRELLRHVGVLA